MNESERDQKLKEIRDEVWNLVQSPLYSYRVQNNYYPVLGEGNHEAQVMFIGEAPGEQESRTGRPFVGRAGKILDKLLASVNWPRESVYITNIVKDRPPANRDPLPDEIKLYAPFLVRQIEVIQPKVIATLGRFSMKYILEIFKLPEVDQPISKLHGKIFSAETSYGMVAILPLYHPAVAVYNQSSYSELEVDFKKLKALVSKTKNEN